MTDMAMPNGNGVPPSVAPDSAPQVLAMLDTMLVLTREAAMDQSGAEAKDRAQAVLAFAQAIVVLDPTLNQQGIPLAHEVVMEQVRQDGQERLEKARQSAAAPTPKKRKLSISRDGNGRMASAEVQE